MADQNNRQQYPQHPPAAGQPAQPQQPNPAAMPPQQYPPQPYPGQYANQPPNQYNNPANTGMQTAPMPPQPAPAQPYQQPYPPQQYPPQQQYQQPYPQQQYPPQQQQYQQPYQQPYPPQQQQYQQPYPQQQQQQYQQPYPPQQQYQQPYDQQQYQQQPYPQQVYDPQQQQYQQPYQQPYGQQPPPNQNFDVNSLKLNLEPNIASVCSYFLFALSGVFFLLTEKDNQFVRFHAMQSVFFTAGWFVIYVLGTILYLIMSSISAIAGFYGPLMLVGIFVNLLYFILFVVWIFTMYKAYSGERFKLPVVGDMAEKHINSIG